MVPSVSRRQTGVTIHTCLELNDHIRPQKQRVFSKSKMARQTRRLAHRQHNRSCRRRPYPLKNTALARSPFRTRKSVHMRGFTARASLKSMGFLPRSNGCYVVGEKYRDLFP